VLSEVRMGLGAELSDAATVGSAAAYVAHRSTTPCGQASQPSAVRSIELFVSSASKPKIEEAAQRHQRLTRVRSLAPVRGIGPGDLSQITLREGPRIDIVPSYRAAQAIHPREGQVVYIHLRSTGFCVFDPSKQRSQSIKGCSGWQEKAT